VGPPRPPGSLGIGVAKEYSANVRSYVRFFVVIKPENLTSPPTLASK